MVHRICFPNAPRRGDADDDIINVEKYARFPSRVARARFLIITTTQRTYNVTNNNKPRVMYPYKIQLLRYEYNIAVAI